MEMNERKEEKEEIDRVLYDDLDLDIWEDDFMERIWRI
jgi:hypothetical protein